MSHLTWLRERREEKRREEKRREEKRREEKRREEKRREEKRREEKNHVHREATEPLVRAVNAFVKKDTSA